MADFDWAAFGESLKRLQSQGLISPDQYASTVQRLQPPDLRGATGRLGLANDPSEPYRNPNVTAGVSVPVAGGDLSMTGQYQPPMPNEPTPWSLGMRYTRPF